MFGYDIQEDNNIDENTWSVKDFFNTASRKTCNSKDCSVHIDESCPCHETPLHRSSETQLKSFRRENIRNTPHVTSQKK